MINANNETGQIRIFTIDRVSHIQGSLDRKLSLLDSRVTRNGLFRRKTPKPSPSVSAEGYFKRTSASRRSSSRRRSGKRTSQRRKSSQQPAARTSSPVWFVPPERRRSRRQRRVWREIRYLPDDEGPILERINDWSSNMSDDQFDDQKLLLSGDFNERREDENVLNSIVSSSLGSFSATSSSSSACPVPKISDFNEDKLFSEELRTNGLLTRRTIWKPSKTATAATATMASTVTMMTISTTASGNYFASSQFLSFLAKGAAKERSKSENSSAGYRYLSSTTDSEDDRADRFNERSRRNVSYPQQRYQHLKRQKSGLRRRPLRRKSQLRKTSGQPVFLVRKCSSLRKRPSKI